MEGLLDVGILKEVWPLPGLGSYVGFASCMHALRSFSAVFQCMSLHADALRTLLCGEDCSGIAHSICLEMLAKRAAQTQTALLPKILAPSTSKGIRHVARTPCGRLKVQRMYVERWDVDGQGMFGANGFVVCTDGTSQYRVIRILIKYGTRLLDVSDAERIVNQLLCSYEDPLDARLHGMPRLRAFRRYLAGYGFPLAGEFHDGPADGHDAPGGSASGSATATATASAPSGPATSSSTAAGGRMHDDGQHLMLVSTREISEQAANLLHDRGIHILAPWVLDQFVWPDAWLRLHYDFLGWARPVKPSWWKPAFDSVLPSFPIHKSTLFSLLHQLSFF